MSEEIFKVIMQPVFVYELDTPWDFQIVGSNTQSTLGAYRGAYRGHHTEFGYAYRATPVLKSKNRLGVYEEYTLEGQSHSSWPNTKYKGTFTTVTGLVRKLSEFYTDDYQTPVKVLPKAFWATSFDAFCGYDFGALFNLGVYSREIHLAREPLRWDVSENGVTNYKDIVLHYSSDARQWIAKKWGYTYIPYWNETVPDVFKQVKI